MVSGKQARFQRDTNHTISKCIARRAKARSSVITLAAPRLLKKTDAA
jgi:hypothetical protein